MAIGIEIGVRLVEHHQERLAIKCSGKRDALPRVSRKRRSMLSDLRVEAISKLDDHIVDASRPSATLDVADVDVQSETNEGRCCGSWSIVPDRRPMTLLTLSEPLWHGST